MARGTYPLSQPGAQSRRAERIEVPTETELSWARRADPMAEQYENAVGKLSILALMLPRDLAGHRDRYLRDWADGNARDPVFAYAPIDPAGMAALSDLAGMASKHADPWHRLLAEEAEAHLRRYSASATRDPQLLTKASVDENGTPDPALVERAVRLLGEPVPPAAPSLDSATATAVLRAVLDDEGLDAWTVRPHENMAARLSVLAASREIRVRTDVRLSAEQLVRLTVHEIGTHVFRSANARRGARILGLQLAGHTATEEGLAVWHEQRVTPSAPLDRRFALRVIGVTAALTGGFTDVVHELVRYTDIRSAFDIAARAKRGLVDTAAPGGFIKDHVYLAGFLEVERHLALAADDYEALMSCKWPLRRLPLLKTVGLPWETQRPLLTADLRFVERVRDGIHELVAAGAAAGAPADDGR